jgi:hypothetical protein
LLAEEGRGHGRGSNLPKLKRLNLVETDVTDAGVAEFKKARPGVNVATKAAPSSGPPNRAAVRSAK